MIVLQKTSNSQEIKIIPRASGGDKIILTNDQSNKSAEISVTFIEEKYFSKTSAVFDLKEDQFYTLEVYKGTEVIYRDQVFCTNQTVLDYSINKDVYTSNTTDNEYIIL